MSENVKVEPLNKKDEKEKEEEKNTSNKNLYILLTFSIILTLILGSFLIYHFMNNLNSPGKIELIKVKDASEMSKVGSKIVIDLIKKNPKSSIGLASGGTPKGLYKLLIENYNNKKISFKDVKVFSLDEFCGIPKEHPQSYYTYMRNNILNHIDIQESNIHLLNGEGIDLKKDFEKNADDFNKLLKKNPIDLQILSIGGNGHFGFNEPGTPFDSLTHIVKLEDKVRIEKKKLFENDLKKTPSYSITQGVQNVLNAKNVLIIANGKGKAEAIKNLIEGEPTIDVPISWLKKHKGTVYVVADEEACSLLSK